MVTFIETTATRRSRATSAAGFTLVELVVTLTISVVVVSFAAMFVSTPVAGFIDQTRRLRLVDAADAALRRMSRDVRRALPNSVRTRTNGGIVALEILSSIDGGRYREQAPGTPAQILDFSTADASFNVIGPFTQITKPFSSSTHHLVIYNVGVPGADAYALANVITPAGTQIDISMDAFAGEDRVTLSPAFQFSYGSPTRRVYLVEGAVSYLCDPFAATLTRYSGYSIAQNQADRDSSGELLGAGASASLMADRISGCAFTYAPGTSERAGMLTMEITIAEQGELVRLLAQVHVDNAP
jgi:MSHA biogenesis protein MshO